MPAPGDRPDAGKNQRAAGRTCKGNRKKRRNRAEAEGIICPAGRSQREDQCLGQRGFPAAKSKRKAGRTAGKSGKLYVERV